MKDKAFLNLAILFFILFFAGIAIITLDKPASQLLRAATVNPSPLKSFAIVFPQVGIAGGSNGSKKPTEIKTTVTLRGVNGELLPNRRVKLTASLSSVKISPSDTQTTDEKGQAIFFLSSTSTGSAKLVATDLESNVSIVNIPSVEFIE